MKDDDFGPAVVSSVEQGSPARQAGVRAGDRIWRIDGEPMRDLIDYYLLIADDVAHKFELERDGETLGVTVDHRLEGPGLLITDPVFGQVRTCNNRCIFCFVDQLPAGLRGPLYVKDDDYRLSFLQGNFITLTNLDDDDMQRILSEKLSPLYVSLHSTNPHLRRKIFGSPDSNVSLDRLKELLDGGIEVHIQIVLMRGMNDDENLDRTLADLSIDYSTVTSIGVVPVGVSENGVSTVPAEWGYKRESAVEVLDLLESWSMLEEAGPFAADEFFHLCGRRPPVSAYYYDFPQVENGIGLTRMFRDEFRQAANRSGLPTVGLEETAIVTSQMGAWALDGLGISEIGVKVVICRNSLFGPRVNVCGLLPGGDVAEALAGRPGVKRALLPAVSVDEEGSFIDGKTVQQVARETSVDLKVVPCGGGELVSSLLEMSCAGGSS